jgi:hypothetical protein
MNIQGANFSELYYIHARLHPVQVKVYVIY